jgi:hypothetical protein
MAIAKKRVSEETRIYNQVFDTVKSIAVRKLIERGYTYKETNEMLQLAKSMVGKVEKRTEEEVRFTQGKKDVKIKKEYGRITERDLNELTDAWAEALANPGNAEYAMSKFRPAGPEREMSISIPKPPKREPFSFYDVTIGKENYAVAAKKDLNEVVKKPTNWMEKTKAYQLRAALLSGDVIAVTDKKGKTVPPRDFLSAYNKVYSPLLRKPGITPEEIYQKIAIHKRGRKVTKR